MADEGPHASEEFAVRVDNEFGLVKGENLPNHTASMRNRGRFIIPTTTTRLMQFRTMQEVYRFMSHLECLAEGYLPDEDGVHSFDEINVAVRNLIQGP